MRTDIERGGVEMNLRMLKPSRKKVRAGDIFAMQLPDDTYLFGRVILADLPRENAPMPGANLVYVYAYRAPRKEPDPDRLNPDDLLLPPLFINRLPWSKGYFETIEHRPLEPSDVLRQHCFLSSLRGVYFDERRNELPGAVEPVGDWGLHSYRTIDDEISDALGIPRAPE